MLSYFKLGRYNCIYNFNNVMLDLVLSNIHVVINIGPDPLLLIDKHHPALNVIITTSLIYNL